MGAQRLRVSQADGLGVSTVLGRSRHLVDGPEPNRALDRILKSVGLTRGDVYITQACHFAPREDRRQPVPRPRMERSIEAVHLPAGTRKT